MLTLHKYEGLERFSPPTEWEEQVPWMAPAGLNRGLETRNRMLRAGRRVPRVAKMLTMNLLLHCCCAPCATACVESLVTEGIAPKLFWYNPNIHPFTEYQSRRDALLTFAETQNLQPEIIDLYGLRSFLPAIGANTETPQRCEVCYRMRLERTAAYAAEKGFDAFSTTLLISPYQQHDIIRCLGEQIAAQYRIAFLYRDFRPLFRQGQSQARARGLYMQKYCGCIYSEEERYKK